MNNSDISMHIGLLEMSFVNLRPKSTFDLLDKFGPSRERSLKQASDQSSYSYCMTWFQMGWHIAWCQREKGAPARSTAVAAIISVTQNHHASSSKLTDHGINWRTMTSAIPVAPLAAGRKSAREGYVIMVTMLPIHPYGAPTIIT